MHKPGYTQHAPTVGGSPLGSEAPAAGRERGGAGARGHVSRFGDAAPRRWEADRAEPGRGESEQAEPEQGGSEQGEPEQGGSDLQGPGLGGCGGGDPEEAVTGADRDLLDLERELTVFLRRARASSVEMARSVHPDLEPAAYSLLSRLAEAGEQRATELAGYFGVGKATVSRQLAALERLGLVDRAPDPLDGRAFLMRLTEEGRSRVSWVRRARRERYRRRLAALEPAEIADLARLLHRLNGLAAADD